jgi:hypothetical protein
MTPGRQAKMRTNGSRPGKAQRIVDPDLERKCCNGTDTGHGHLTPADLIVLTRAVALRDNAPQRAGSGIKHCRSGDEISALMGPWMRRPGLRSFTTRSPWRRFQARSELSQN